MAKRSAPSTSAASSAKATPPRLTAHHGLTPEGWLDFARGGPREDTSPTIGHWLNARIDRHWEEEGSKRGPWPVLSPSMFDGVCLRKTAYSYVKEREDWADYQASGGRRNSDYRRKSKFEGRMLRLFGDGDVLEARTITDLRAIGFVIADRDDAGKQLGFRAADDGTGWARYRGKCDGVVTYSPVQTVKAPCILEIKSMNAKKFKEFSEKGIKVAAPHYYIQVQQYMSYMGLTDNPAMFAVYSKDNSAYGFEFVPFDVQNAQEWSDNAVRVIEAAAPSDIPRVADVPDDHRCMFCEHRIRCWERPTMIPTSASVPRPDWL